MILWYWHLDQPMSTEITLSLKETNRLLCCCTSSGLAAPVVVEQVLQGLVLSKHTPAQPLLAQKAAAGGEEQVSVKGHRSGWREKRTTWSAWGQPPLLGWIFCRQQWVVKNEESNALGLYVDMEQKRRVVGELRWELAIWCWWERKADGEVTQHLF